ncbi:hypothetical protein [Lacrimispora sphenoides]|uniref:Uncharacterized protein n=1 Tax=Lacrimispora sphenoides JCM 1415 TaxID=1297793 RepID=A0ABY1CH10_9FIRM|nr:hypothetical protein [Lacrimispora sphenoides]SEU04177.1 hypothetical protein SAMN02745906_4274 [[Clostridium] sphenoides JCM 1415]SUY48851.1 Uncharacterised protein [Lacrimispora sphenoides]
MDNRTKAVSNFVACLERNKGADRNGQPWYNEGFESITVIEHYSAYKLGFTGSGGSVRSSALDPKLTGYLKDRADTLDMVMRIIIRWQSQESHFLVVK